MKLKKKHIQYSYPIQYYVAVKKILPQALRSLILLGCML